MGDVQLVETEVEDLLNGPDGPVTGLMVQLSEEAAAVALAKVHVFDPFAQPDAMHVRRAFLAAGRTLSSGPLSPRSTSFPPGYTKASIRTDVHWHEGLVYGGVSAAEFPTVYLEEPAEQMEREYPFLTTGLNVLVI